MSQKASTSAASSHFQAIFGAALKSYEKQTKKDLIAHPLASQLQSCDSTSAILALLKDQVREFDRAHSGDERLTNWLNPTVSVLFAFSAAISGGISLVSLDMHANLSFLICTFAVVLACECHICRHRCLPLSKYPIYFFRQIILTSWDL